MSFSLPPLPYPHDALAPHISERTLRFHYDKHHRGYVDKLNAATQGKPEALRSLDELVRTLAPGPTFNFAAQAWNHQFYWQCLNAHGGGDPNGDLAKRIASDFGSAGALRQKLAEAAKNEFGSGWAWLAARDDGSLQVCSTDDAENPLQSGLVPLLTIDVWEHAYYLDYQHEREKYIAAVLDHLLCWEFAAANYAACAYSPQRTQKRARP